MRFFSVLSETMLSLTSALAYLLFCFLILALDFFDNFFTVLLIFANFNTGIF